MLLLSFSMRKSNKASQPYKSLVHTMYIFFSIFFLGNVFFSIVFALKKLIQYY